MEGTIGTDDVVNDIGCHLYTSFLGFFQPVTMIVSSIEPEL